MDQLSARAAAFYASLGASFDIAFTDIGDRDAEFKRAHYGDNGASWWDAADFVRYARFIGGFVAATGKRMVVWQIPLGNTKMRAMNNTWGHYQDNRVEWFLDDPGGTHLALWRDAGVVALLYGGGAGGTTCACDAIGDGTTNPAAINGNTRAVALGRRRWRLLQGAGRGLLRQRRADDRDGLGPAAAAAAGRALDGERVRQADDRHPRPFGAPSRSGSRPSVTIRARVQVDVYDAANHRVYSHLYGVLHVPCRSDHDVPPGLQGVLERSGRHVQRQDPDHLGDRRVPRQPQGHRRSRCTPARAPGHRASVSRASGPRAPCRGPRHGRLPTERAAIIGRRGGWRSER